MKKRTSKKSSRNIESDIQKAVFGDEGIMITADITGSMVHRIACDPACGFMVQSTDEAEAKEIIREHAKSVHRVKVTDADINSSADIVPAGVG